MFAGVVSDAAFSGAGVRWGVSGVEVGLGVVAQDASEMATIAAMSHRMMDACHVLCGRNELGLPGLTRSYLPFLCDGLARV